MRASASSGGASATTTRLPSLCSDVKLPDARLTLQKLPADHEHASTLDLAPHFAATPSEVAAMVVSQGFALLRNVLSDEACASVLQRCMVVTDEMLSIDTNRHGNRGRGRYSMGGASKSGQQFHNAEWALLATDSVLDAVESIYGVDGYVLRGGGGEIVLGNVDEYQDLHADVSRVPLACDTQARPPFLVVNFALHHIGEDHGPTRIWPRRGRPRDSKRPVRQDLEPRSILRSTLAPVPQGACTIRDPRIWHGGTPNYRSYPRYLPNLEFLSQEYYDYLCGGRAGESRFNRPTMTPEVFALLSPRAQHAARSLVSSAAIPRGIKPNFVRAQGNVSREQILSNLLPLQVGDVYTFSGNGHECHQVKDLAEARGFACQMGRDGR